MASSQSQSSPLLLKSQRSPLEQVTPPPPPSDTATTKTPSPGGGCAQRPQPPLEGWTRGAHTSSLGEGERPPPQSSSRCHHRNEPKGSLLSPEEGEATAERTAHAKANAKAANAKAAKAKAANAKAAKAKAANAKAANAKAANAKAANAKAAKAKAANAKAANRAANRAARAAELDWLSRALPVVVQPEVDVTAGHPLRCVFFQFRREGSANEGGRGGDEGGATRISCELSLVFEGEATYVTPCCDVGYISESEEEEEEEEETETDEEEEAAEARERQRAMSRFRASEAACASPPAASSVSPPPPPPRVACLPTYIYRSWNRFAYERTADVGALSLRGCALVGRTRRHPFDSVETCDGSGPNRRRSQRWAHGDRFQVRGCATVHAHHYLRVPFEDLKTWRGEGEGERENTRENKRDEHQREANEEQWAADDDDDDDAAAAAAAGAATAPTGESLQRQPRERQRPRRAGHGRPIVFVNTCNHMVGSWDANPRLPKHAWVHYRVCRGGRGLAEAYARACLPPKPNLTSVLACDGAVASCANQSPAEKEEAFLRAARCLVRVWPPPPPPRLRSRRPSGSTETQTQTPPHPLPQAWPSAHRPNGPNRNRRHDDKDDDGKEEEEEDDKEKEEEEDDKEKDDEEKDDEEEEKEEEEDEAEEEVEEKEEEEVEGGMESARAAATAEWLLSAGEEAEAGRQGGEAVAPAAFATEGAPRERAMKR